MLMYSRIVGRRSDRLSGPRLGVGAALRLPVVIGVTFFFVFPYLWLAGSAFRPREEIFRYVNPVSWRTFIPIAPTLDNFRHLFFELNFGRALANSLFLAIVTVTITLLICSMIAFALARIKFPGREVVFMLILATILIPFETIMVSVFLTIQRLDCSIAIRRSSCPGLRMRSSSSCSDSTFGRSLMSSRTPPLWMVARYSGFTGT